jgi:hypothetical protein
MRMRIMLCAGIVFCLAGMLEAQDTNWVPAPGKKLWSDADNWSNGVPTSAGKAKFTTPDECLLDFDGAEAKNVDLGGGPLRIYGDGVLTVYDWFILGYSADDIGDNAGHLEVYNGGVLNCMQRLYVGREGEGYLTVWEDGTVNVLGQHLNVAQTTLDTSLGVVTLEGGSINILEGTDSQGLRNTGSNATVNFKGGLMRLRNTAANQTYLDTAVNNGVIIAYDGVGEVVVTTDEETGIISIRGVHPLKPSPSDDGLASPGAVELNWTLPDPLVAGEPVPVNVYFTDDLNALQQFTDPAAIQVVNKQAVTSIVVQAQPKTRYYWAVDAYVGGADDPVLGPIFSFYADNPAPVVDAGIDLVTWLGEDGTRIKSLDATVTDDGAYTVQWTVVSEPNDPNNPDAVIADPSAENTSITLSALGEYVLQLEASDGEKTGSDTVAINVYRDGCEAAKSLPDYVPFPGDLNGDCKVDDLDLAILQEDWLKDNSLTEP